MTWSAGIALLLWAAAPAAPPPDEERQDVEIRFEHRVAASYPQGVKIVLDGNMVGADEVDHAELYVRPKGGRAWQLVDLELVSGALYRAEIPRDIVRPGGLEYYVVATDFLGGRHDAFASVDAPASLAVTHDLPEDGEEVDEDSITDGEDEPSAPSDAEPEAPAPRPQAEPVPPTAESKGAPPPSAPAAPDDRPDRGQLAAPAIRIDLPAPGRVGARRPDDVGALVLDAATVRLLGVRDLADLLRLIPEVEVTRTLDGELRVSWRGRPGDGDVLVRLDGQPLNDPITGRVPAIVPVMALRRVVARPPTTLAARTFSALGGCIDLETGMLELTGDTAGVDLSAGGGSYASQRTDGAASRFGTYRLAALGFGAIGGIRISGYAGLDLSDGTQARIATDAYSGTGIGGDASDAPGPLRDGSIALNAGGGARLLDLDAGTLDVGAHYLFLDRGGGIGRTDTYGPGSHAGDHTLLLQGQYRTLLGERGAFAARVAADVHARQRRWQLAPSALILADRDADGEPERFPDGMIEQTDDLTFGVSGEAGADFEVTDGQVLTGGFLAGYQQVVDATLLRNFDADAAAVGLRRQGQAPPVPNARQRLSLGVFLEDTWSPIEALTLEAGLRVAWYNDVELRDPARLLGPRLAVTWRPLVGLSSRVAYETTYRPPTFAERGELNATTLPPALRTDRYVGDPSLAGTTAHNVDLEVAWTAAEGPFGWGALVGGSYSYVVDAIAEVPVTGALDAVSARALQHWAGVRLEGWLEVRPAVRLSAAGYWLRGLDVSTDAGSRLLTSVPQLGATLMLSSRVLDLFDVSLAVRYLGERRNETRTALEKARAWRLPAAAVVDAAVRSLPIAGLVRIGLTAHNTLDAGLYDPVPRPDLVPDGVPAPGLLLMATVDFAYERELQEAGP